MTGPSLFDFAVELTRAQAAAYTGVRLAPVTYESTGDRLAREAAERDRVLASLARLRKDYLAQIRTHLKRLDRPVTADDARAYFDQMPNVPGPDTLSRNFLGATFKEPGWVATGDMVLSTTKGRHANRIFVWRWEGD